MAPNGSVDPVSQALSSSFGFMAPDGAVPVHKKNFQKLEEGWRGPVLLAWLYRLLDDREERVGLERRARGASTTLTEMGTHVEGIMWAMKILDFEDRREYTD